MSRYTNHQWAGCFIQWLAHKNMLEEWMDACIYAEQSRRNIHLQLIAHRNGAAFFENPSDYLYKSFLFSETSEEREWNLLAMEWQDIVYNTKN